MEAVTNAQMVLLTMGKIATQEQTGTLLVVTLKRVNSDPTPCVIHPTRHVVPVLVNSPLPVRSVEPRSTLPATWPRRVRETMRLVHLIKRQKTVHRVDQMD